MIVDLLKTLADENRLKILKLLYSADELCVCEIEKSIGLSQSNASKHLNKLRREGLINKEKKAQWAWYSINRNLLEKHSFIKSLILEELEDINIDKKECNI